MALKDQITKSDTRYTTPSARRVIEDHMEYLRQKARMVAVNGVLSTKYQTNMYGLYKALGISKSLWWITSRVNRFDHTTVINDLTFIAVPDNKQVDALIKINSTKQVALF